MEIKEIRKKTGLSQTLFSKKFGIPVATLRDWEQGRRKCPDYVNTMLEIIIDNYLMEDIEMRGQVKSLDVINRTELGNYIKTQFMMAKKTKYFYLEDKYTKNPMIIKSSTDEGPNVFFWFWVCEYKDGMDKQIIWRYDNDDEYQVAVSIEECADLLWEYVKDVYQ